MSSEKINSSLPLNRTVSVAKAGGSGQEQFNPTPLPSPVEFDQNPSNNVGDATAQAALEYISGSTLGIATKKAKNDELAPSRDIDDDGFHRKLHDTEIITTGYTFSQDLGAWISPTGNVITDFSTLPTGQVDLEILDGSGDYGAKSGRFYGGNYHYRVGISGTEKNIDIRNQ